MSSTTHRPTSDFGPITATFVRFFGVLQRLSPSHWLSHWLPSLKSRRELPEDKLRDAAFIKRRIQSVDRYIIAWIIAELVIAIAVCFLARTWICCVALLLSGIRVIEIVQYSVSTTLFDRITGRSDDLIASWVRMVVVAFINFIELIVCFGIVYACLLDRLHSAPPSVVAPIHSFYFSVITQLTIGFGDIAPTGILRLIAPIQGVVSFVFVALVFGRFVSTVPPMIAVLDPPPAERLRVHPKNPCSHADGPH